nr:RNA-directed DNA polymerase, eukaryota, reverse transcriptase zinc-binding domain protein [Tanacetum cinerariifolium]
PIVDGEGDTIARMSVEYKWKPPRCSDCLVFRHMTEQCPKRVKVVPHTSVPHSNEKSTTIDGDGFTTVVNHKSKGKGAVENASKPSSFGTQAGKESNLEGNTNGIKLKNLFKKLNEITTTVDPNDEMVFRSWDWTSNASICTKGCRIILGWNKYVVDVMVVAQSDQAIHAKKLDRIIGNLDFVNKFPSAYALFQPYRISDHSPAVLKMPSLSVAKPKPFKFYNFLAHKDKFSEVVASTWCNQISGHAMFQVTQKMKLLKKPLRKLLHDQGNLHERVDRLCVELDAVFLGKRESIPW